MTVDPWRDRARRALATRLRENLPTDSRPHYVICGSDPLIYTIAEELAGHRVRVTAVVPPRMRADVPDLAALRGVRVLRAERLDERTFKAAGLEGAHALALVNPDDVGNIHAALCAQEVESGLRLVMRMFNPSLGNGVKQLFADCTVLSDAAMAAPAFVAASLGELTPTYFRHAGRTLTLVRRSEARPEHVVCVLDAGERGVLPPDGTPAAPTDLVLAEAAGRTPGMDVAARRIVRHRRRRKPLLALGSALRAALNRKLGVAVLVTLVVTLVSGTILAQADPVDGFWESIYVTLLTAVGSSDVEMERNHLAQASQLALTISGLALLPLITAAVVEGVVNARLALASGRVRTPREDHVVVVGLGNVGTRVIRQLTDLGIEVVAIDRKAQPLGAKTAEELGVPLIVGDAALQETLRSASVDTCQALVVVSTDDVTNLQAALNARAVREDLRVVLRLFDGDFALRVQRAFNLGVSRSVSYLAAPAFAAALLDRHMIATIPVDRHALLVTEVTVQDGAPLAGRPLRAAGEPGRVRVLGLTPHGSTTMSWLPNPAHVLRPGDRLAVVARRVGLRTLAERAATPPPPVDGSPAA
ncbi:NAD-binding protein [Spirilliplanes yamanashiensis]|uniref:Potassium transporter TrkA n=1 Tax=Spirilliplanes yamanashiensis TaxID=42233 RepID=A0A8J4DIG9_9ACTN|nr:NAD-binding protein [Spirilliplanes yamanashiensis]MDP9814505.1 Trk K+ transport system NAD-binding subunit [Spirilliplanes yamanashiensis]GIJ02158.1 potassium transporter TrkA [Spirilliplanes yamanashiensis]